MPGHVLNTISMNPHGNLMSKQYSYPHFIDMETGAQNRNVSCSRSHSC